MSEKNQILYSKDFSFFYNCDVCFFLFLLFLLFVLILMLRMNCSNLAFWLGLSVKVDFGKKEKKGWGFSSHIASHNFLNVIIEQTIIHNVKSLFLSTRIIKTFCTSWITVIYILFLNIMETGNKWECIIIIKLKYCKQKNI